MPETTTAKTKAAKRAVKKQPGAGAAAASRNGAPMGRMSEKTKPLTLRAFRKVSESYHRKTA